MVSRAVMLGRSCGRRRRCLRGPGSSARRSPGPWRRATHAAIGLEAAALVEDGLAGRLVDAGEEGADHDDVGAGGDGLGEVAGVLDAAVGDDGDAVLGGGAGGLGDGGDLRHAGAGDHACGADGAGADADLDGVGAGVDEGLGAVVGGDVAGEESYVGEALLDFADGFEDAGGVAVGGVDGEGVDAHVDEGGGALEEVAGGADGSGYAEAALLVLGGVGVLELLLDVFDGDEALELVVVVDDEELFDAVLVEDLFGLLERGADGDGDEVVLGHHVADGDVGAGDEAEVAVGEDADEAALAGDGDAGDLEAAHELERVGDGLLGRDGDRVDDHAGLGALDLVDLAGLLLDGEVAMDYAHASLLGHGDGEARLGDGVHGGGHQRGVERDALGELGLGADLGGDYVGVGRDEQYIVEGEGFGDRACDHGSVYCCIGRGVGARRRLRIIRAGLGHERTRREYPRWSESCRDPRAEGYPTCRTAEGRRTPAS